MSTEYDEESVKRKRDGQDKGPNRQVKKGRRGSGLAGD